MIFNRAQRRSAAKRKPEKVRRKVNPAAALNPILFSTTLEPSETVVMKLRVREAFEAIRTGTGTKDDFDHMAISYNAWQVLAENIDTILCERMLPAGLALMRAKERVLAGKALLWDGQAIEPLQEFMDIYDTIIDNISPRQAQDAIVEGYRRQTGHKLNKRQYSHEKI